MTFLKIPILQDPRATIGRWAQELRKTNFQTDPPEWTDWAATIDDLGMTTTVNNIYAARYKLVDDGSECRFYASGSLTITGAASTQFSIAAPPPLQRVPTITNGACGYVFQAFIGYAAATFDAYGFMLVNDRTITIQQYDVAVLPVALVTFGIQGFYEVQQ